LVYRDIGDAASHRGARDSRAGQAILEARSRADITIHVLGSFRLFRQGSEVSSCEWRSKKACNLLKILALRRGTVATRDYLMETLWPGLDPRNLRNRLSVALATVRSTLDPQRRFPSGHFVLASRSAVLLAANVWVDLDAFHAETDAAIECLERRTREALQRLWAAEELYTGDVLEEDLYTEWTILPRERARMMYVSVARALARHATDNADHDAARRWYLKILDRDPYDEQAHIGLMASLQACGRLGAARSAMEHYKLRMTEIGVEICPSARLVSA
jgi:DNA-binding SARP family transcriptional activator